MKEKKSIFTLKNRGIRRKGRLKLLLILLLSIISFLLLGREFSYFLKEESFLISQIECPAMNLEEFTGRHIWKVPLKDIASVLAKNRFIKEIYVMRKPEERMLSVKFKKRQPFAYSFFSEYQKFQEFDEEGVPLEKTDNAALNLPLITGDSIQQALDAIKRVISSGMDKKRVSQLDLGPGGEITIFTMEGRQINLGNENLEEKLSMLKRVERELNNREMDYAYIDLRFRDEAIVKMKKQEAQK